MSEHGSPTGLSPESGSSEALADAPLPPIPEYVETLVTASRHAANDEPRYQRGRGSLR